MSIKVKSIVSSQLPDFVREDYQTFAAFVEAYYEYLDQTEQRNLTDLRDIDRTIEDFIVQFKQELNIFGESDYQNINPVLLMRKIKQVYTAKGSEAAYRLLFRILFNKTADISYPWDQVLKASDGKWNQETAIFVNNIVGDVNDLPGNKITILGQNTRIKVYVERIEQLSDSICQIFISKNYYGTINVGNTVEYTGFSATVVPTTVSYVVEKAGSGFKIGDIIPATTISGGNTIESLLKNTKVDDNGGIVALSTIKFGAGYSGEFFTMINKTTMNTASTFSLTKDLVQQLNVPDTSFLDQYLDYGFLVDPNFVDPDYSNPTYVGLLLREFYNQTVNNQTNPDYALIRFGIGAVAKYQGYYTTNDGFLDDIIKIQDSYYYQKYSYLVTIDERLEDYKSILKSFMHPAGTALFGEYQIQNSFNVGISCTFSLSEYESKATFNTINKDINNEFVVPSGAGGRIRIEPYDLESYFEPTYNPETFQDFTG